MTINTASWYKENSIKKLRELAKNKKRHIASILLISSFLLPTTIYAEDDKKPNSKKTGETTKNEANTNESTTKIHENLIYELFTNKTLPDLSEKSKELQIKREWNYLGTNEERNLKFDGDFHRKRLIEWFSRMVQEWHLDMIVKKFKEHKIPVEILFLAIAESYRESDIISPAQAKWFWQFIEPSAKIFWAIDESGNDFRSDPEISTDAAINHLRYNYEMVEKRSKELWIPTTNENKRMFAMYLYNWWPKLVKKAFIESKWDVNTYPSFQKSNENKNYVPRVLAIRNVLYELGKRYNFDIEAMKHHRLIECCYKKSLSEIMIEEYFWCKNNLDYESQYEEIFKIKSQLIIDYKKCLLSYDTFLEKDMIMEWELSVLQITNNQQENQVLEQ